MSYLKQEIISLIDLTSLNNDDTRTEIDVLISKSLNALGAVAAICIYPEFVSYAKAKIKIKVIILGLRQLLTSLMQKKI